MTTLAPRAIPAVRRATTLYCTVHGSGAPVLLVHGLGVSGAVFQPLIPRLAANYQVIVPDLRGHGQSRRLPAPDNIDRLADDLENLLDLLRIQSCFVVGYATGGAIAQRLAYSQRNRVRGLALICSYARSASNLREQIEARLRPRLFQLIGSRGMGVLAAQAGCSRTPHDDDYAFVRDTIAGNSGDCVASVARAVQSFDSRPWLHTLMCPTLVVAGEADTTTPPHHARELAAHIPQAQLRVVRGAGHWLVKTHADELLDVVLPWLAEHEVAA